MTPLSWYLIVSALLFSIGLAGVLVRRSAILVLIGIELMLNAANLNLVAFWRFGPNPQELTGIVFVLFAIAVAAAEASVGFALILAVARNTKSTDLERITDMRG